MMRLLCCLLLWVPLAVHAETLSHGNFKDVRLLEPAGPPRSVVLLLSGDGGGNAGFLEIAKVLADQGALVVAIDTPAYLKALALDGGGCGAAVGNFENLSHFVQAYAKLPDYHPPLLVGYATGANLGRALTMEAPAGTLAGALLLAFCPEPRRNLPQCQGQGQSQGIPVTLLQGGLDQVCPAAPPPAGARVVVLPNIDHGFSNRASWQPRFVDEYARLVAATTPVTTTAAPPAAIADLPLIEVPAKTPGDTFAVLISGDGGWAGLDRDVAGALSERNVQVVGLDSLRYFWTARTPEGFGADLTRVLQAYLAKGFENAWLIGYSQGGDVLPFALNRLPREVRSHVRVAAAIAPEEKASFEFHLANWVGSHGDRPLQPEMDRLRDDPALLCIYGRDENNSICPKLDAAHYRVVGLPGGHHFNGNYALLADTILQGAR